MHDHLKADPQFSQTDRTFFWMIAEHSVQYPSVCIEKFVHLADSLRIHRIFGIQLDVRPCSLEVWDCLNSLRSIINLSKNYLAFCVPHIFFGLPLQNSYNIFPYNLWGFWMWGFCMCIYVGKWESGYLYLAIDFKLDKV